MKILFFRFSIFFSILISLSSASGKNLIIKKLKLGNIVYLLSVDSVPSRPNSKGQGFCGSGEEVTLKILFLKSNMQVFSKLIESCLESIELKNGHLGLETAESLSRAIDFNKVPLEINWIKIGDRTNITGNLDLSGKSLKYSEF